MPSFSGEELNNVGEHCEAGKFPPPLCDRPFPIEPSFKGSEDTWMAYRGNLSLIKYLLELYRNACEAIGFSSLAAYEFDIVPAIETIKSEFLHHATSEHSEWWVVYGIVMT